MQTPLEKRPGYFDWQMEFTQPHGVVFARNGVVQPIAVLCQLLVLFTQNALSWHVFDRMVQSESDAQEGHSPPELVAAWSTHGLVRICCGAPQPNRNATKKRGTRTVVRLAAAKTGLHRSTGLLGVRARRGLDARRHANSRR
jgi:hypothetical protein